MRSAIRTYALAVDAPDALPKDALHPGRRALRARAARSATARRACRGTRPSSPCCRCRPNSSATVDDWTDAQLFRIVKHGIRFTGMPAWPTPGARRRGLDDGRVPARAARARQQRPTARRPSPTPRCRNRLPAAPPAMASTVAAAARTCRSWPGRARPICARACAPMPRAIAPAASCSWRSAGCSSGELAALARHYAALPRRGAARAPARDRSARPSSQAGAARPTAFPPASIAMPAAATRTSPPSPGSEPTTSPRSSSSSAPGSAAAPPIAQVMTRVAQGLDDAGHRRAGAILRAAWPMSARRRRKRR